MNNEAPSELIAGIYEGNPGAVMTLLDEENININATDEAGNSALALSCQNAEMGQVSRKLIELGANINKGEFEIISPLAQCIIYDNDEIAKFLIESGAELTPDVFTAIDGRKTRNGVKSNIITNAINAASSKRRPIINIGRGGRRTKKRSQRKKSKAKKSRRRR